MLNMGKLKNVMKFIVPSPILEAHRKFKLYNWRIGMIEQEMKNRWLLENAPAGDQKETLRRKEFQIYSQTGEDGIINHIFQKIGTSNKTFVEIGIEDGRQCNTALLSLHFGWRGLLIEGDKKYARKAQEYYKDKPVRVLHGFVTKENINGLITKGGVKGEIDLLSIDVDGNDYWIWKAIDVVQPRVVVVEYNSILGEEARTIKYRSGFERFKGHESGYYYGASLSALNKLAESKGYILVGCNTWGFNAFFIRKKDAKKMFKHLKADEASYLPNGEDETRRRFSLIKHMPFELI